MGIHLTQLLDQAKTKHAGEFKEAWYSVDKNTTNRHVDIPPAFLQLRHSSNLNNFHRRAPACRGETRALIGGVNIHIFLFCPTNFF